MEYKYSSQTKKKQKKQKKQGHEQKRGQFQCSLAQLTHTSLVLLNNYCTIINGSLSLLFR
jgi:hypothetical protein